MFYQRMERLFPFVFLFIGSIFIVVAVVFLSSEYAFIKTAQQTQGKVVDMVMVRSSKGNAMWAPIVDFESADHVQIEFKSNISSNPPAFKLGDKVTVYYDSANPYNAQVKSFWTTWFFPSMFGGLGLIAFLVGLGIVITRIQHQQLINWLREHGTRVTASGAHSELNTSMSVNGVNPYVVRCQWLNPSTNQMFLFQSDSVWFNPDPYLKGDEIVVIIDPQDPKRYYIDLSFLPQLA